MGRRRKLYDRIASGQSDANTPFEQTRGMLVHLGFDECISGSHHVFTRDGVSEIINLQNVRGECKPYQVKRVRTVLLTYRGRREHDHARLGPSRRANRGGRWGFSADRGRCRDGVGSVAEDVSEGVGQTLDAQESNMRISRRFFESWIEMLEEHSGVAWRSASRTLLKPPSARRKS